MKTIKTRDYETTEGSALAPFFDGDRRRSTKTSVVQPDVKLMVALIMAVVMTLMSMWLLMHA